MRLPTNPEMLEGVRRLETFRSRGVVEEGGVVGKGRGDWGQQEEGRGRDGWNALLGPPGSHRMLYTLQIVDGVLDFVMAWDRDGDGEYGAAAAAAAAGGGAGAAGGGGAGAAGGGGRRREWEVCWLVALLCPPSC